MHQTTPATESTAPVACAVDRTCGTGSGCGCRPTDRPAIRRRGLRTALVGAVCVLGCLAVPVAVGGFAAVGGALAGEAWVIVAGVAIAVAIGVVLARRRGSVC